MRLVFMGSPAFSVPTLQALMAAGHDIAAVYSQPPRASARRGKAPVPTPVHQAAERAGLLVRTPVSLKSEAEQAAFRDLGADAAVVVAYGLLLPPAILEATRLGAWNGHGSLLPRWRGAAPIQRAIMAGDERTGMMIMKMEEGLDTGPVALTEQTPIGPQDTAGDLAERLSAIGARLMVDAMARLEAGTLTLVPQPSEGVTYAAKIRKEEARIDWSRPAVEVDRLIRGLSPSPGAWCEFDAGNGLERLRLLRSHLVQADGPAGAILDQKMTVACGTGAVRLVQVQRAGGKPLDGADFLRGATFAGGARLS